MAGRGGIGLDTRPLVRDPGFVDPFADPSGSSSPQPNASLQGDAETLITQRSLGFAVTAGYSLPKLALVGAQTFAAAHAVAWVRRGDRHDDSATIVTVAAFGSVVVASYVQLVAAHFGDGLRTRFGRRRPVLLAIALLCAVSMYLLVAPPAPVADSPVFYGAVFALLNIFCEVGSTMLNALGTEMTALKHRDARTSLFAWQTAAGIVGYALASILALELNATDRSSGGSTGTCDSLFCVGAPPGASSIVAGIGFAVLILVTISVGVAATSEDPVQNLPQRRFRADRTSFVPGLRWIMRNSQWKVYIMATAPLNLIGELMTIIPSIFIYKNYDWDGGAGEGEEGEGLKYARWALIVYSAGFVISAAFVAPRLAKRWNKLIALRCFVMMAFVYSILGFAASFEATMLLVSTALLGLARGGIQALKPALLSDVVDYGELICGQRQEGTYQAISAMFHLWMTFLGRAVPLFILSDTNQVQKMCSGSHSAGEEGDDIATWMQLVFLGVVPLVVTLVAALYLQWFQLQDQTTADKVQRFLGQRRQGQTQALYDPITHTPISTDTDRHTGRRARGASRSPQADSSTGDGSDDTGGSDGDEARVMANNLLYFSHGDLTLISKYGTAKFLVSEMRVSSWRTFSRRCPAGGLLHAIGGVHRLPGSADCERCDPAPPVPVPLLCWLCVLKKMLQHVAAAAHIFDQARRADTSKGEIWSGNATSLNVWDPEVNWYNGRLMFGMILGFVASAALLATLYHILRCKAAYWLTKQPRRDEFAQIVAQRKQEREAESVGVTAWIASKFSGTVTIATMVALIAVVVLIGAVALSNHEGDPCSS